MKAAAFDLVRPETLAEAAALLAGPDCRAMAGGQSLGPMLNLRLARPAMIVPIAHLAELRGVAEDEAAITLGAATTHAEIEDGRTPDLAGGILARIAGGIAYRAVRNRGTIGGSLCHADPAADWACTLTALGASVRTWRPQGGRWIALPDFVTGAFRTVLMADEILQAVRIPRPASGARFGYVKSCRKPGEFAHAMAAVLDDPARGVRRAVIGATGNRPVILEGPAAPAREAAALAGSGLDTVAVQMELAALRRARAQVAA